MKNIYNAPGWSSCKSDTGGEDLPYLNESEFLNICNSTWEKYLALSNSGLLANSTRTSWMIFSCAHWALIKVPNGLIHTLHQYALHLPSKFWGRTKTVFQATINQEYWVLKSVEFCHYLMNSTRRVAQRHPKYLSGTTERNLSLTKNWGLENSN